MNEFVDHISRVAFRGLHLDNKGYIEPRYELTSETLRQIAKDHTRWGFSSDMEARQAAERALQFIDNSYLQTDSNILFVDRNLSIGTLVQMERTCGGVVRMIYMGDMHFMVIYDSLPQLLPNDILTPLQWTICAGEQAFFSVIRHNKHHPSQNQILNFKDILRVRVSLSKSHENIRNDAIENILSALRRMHSAEEMIKIIDGLCTEYHLNLNALANIANIVIREREDQIKKTLTTDFICYAQPKISTDEIIAKVHQEIMTHANTTMAKPDTTHEKELQEKCKQLEEQIHEQRQQLEEIIIRDRKEINKLKEHLQKYEILKQ